MRKELAGKGALVRGASRGIGAATAVTLAAAGVSHVAVHYNSWQEGAEETAERIRNAGAQAELIRADLSGSDGIHALCGEIAQLKPDILINNAGHLVRRARLAEYTEDLFDQVNNLNTKSVYFVTQAAAPGMIGKKSGVIVNVSSIAARNGGGPGATIYAAA